MALNGCREGVLGFFPFSNTTLCEIGNSKTVYENCNFLFVGTLFLLLPPKLTGNWYFNYCVMGKVVEQRN